MADNLKSLEEQALKLIGEAEDDRNLHQEWHRDVYRYCMPWRRRPKEWQQKHDQDDLFDSTAIEALADFAADMQTTFTPIEDDWLDVEVAETLPGYTAAQLAPKLKEYQTAVFSEIRRSNFHEAAQEAYPDLGTGTCGLIIQDVDINAPFQCQAIPITDLLIVRGVYGGVDGKVRVIANMKLRDLQATYPKATFNSNILSRIKSSPGSTVCVHECCWRLWDKPGVEQWRYVLLVDNKAAQTDLWTGAGSCPIITARWRTDSTTAWGVGALYVVLPTIKTLDQLQYLIMKHLSFAVDPAGFYDDDGVINLDNGLEPGTMIPRATGSKIEPYESEADFQTGFFERKDMQSDIKRALFQDKPYQPGATPPTAAQWMDQKAETARRMGSPFGRLTTEWQWAIFQRFVYLLEKRGQLPVVKLNGNAVRLRPQSPLIKAQRQQKAVVADRFLEILATRFGPNLLTLITDPIQTAAKLKDALGDDLVQLRDESQIKALTQVATQAAQNAGQLPQGPQGAAGAQAPPPGP